MTKSWGCQLLKLLCEILIISLFMSGGVYLFKTTATGSADTSYFIVGLLLTILGLLLSVSVSLFNLGSKGE